MYGKLFDAMYDGTLRECWQALVTFQQLIILGGPNGIVDMTPHAIHGRTGIPLEIIQAGLKHLEQPDPNSRSPVEAGRRIVRLESHRPWGWRLVNHRHYRDLISAEQKREADRVRIAAKRESGREDCDMSQPVASSREESPTVANVAHADADTEANIYIPTARADDAGENEPYNGKATETRSERSDADSHPGFAAMHDWSRIPGLNAKAFATFVEHLLQAVPPKALSDGAKVAQAKRLALTGPPDHQAALVDLHCERDWRNIRPLTPELLAAEVRAKTEPRVGGDSSGSRGSKRATYKQAMEALDRE